VTSSPRRSTGVETDDVTQPPAVHDEVDALADESTPSSQGADADVDAETAAREAVSSENDEKPTDVTGGPDEGPATDPHGLPPVDGDADSEPTTSGPGVAGPLDASAGGAATGYSATDASIQQAPALVPPPAPEQPSRVRPAVRRTGKVRKARLRLLRVEPWSVMKSAFVLSIAIGITLVVAAATLWSVIDAAGVFEVVGTLITDLTESESSTGIEVQDYVGFSRVVGLATVIAVVDVVLLTALATLFAFLYNLSAALLGGFEVTLAEDD